MYLTVDGLISAADLETLKNMGVNWDRESSYFPVFHPNLPEEMPLCGYGSDPVKVTMRIEVVAEEPQEEEKEES